MIPIPWAVVTAVITSVTTIVTTAIKASSKKKQIPRLSSDSRNGLLQQFHQTNIANNKKQTMQNNAPVGSRYILNTRSQIMFSYDDNNLYIDITAIADAISDLFNGD